MNARLPIEALREALACADFERAGRLLADHDAAVRAALPADGVIAPGDVPAWKAELDLQTQLLLEMQAARDHAGRELARLQREQRGARAYLVAGGGA